MRSRDRVTLIAAVVAIATAVLAVGGAPRWSLAVIAVPTLIAVGAQINSRRGFRRPQPLLVLIGIAFGITLAQAIPLPIGARETLEPSNHQLIDEGRALLGDHPPTFAPLSVDPPATRRAAADLALALALAWVLLRIASSPDGRHWILAGVAGTCGVAALVGVFERLAGASALYGLYEPHHAHPTVLGPLLNPNSYGSLLVLGAMVSGGLALVSRQATSLRVIWALNVVLCLAVTFATLSRGAAIAAGIGTVTTVGVWFGARRREHGTRRRRRAHLLRVTVPAVTVVMCGLALVVLTSAGQVTQQLEDTSSAELHDPNSKFGAWHSSLELVRESPWIGVGRGGFETAFTRVHPESAFGTFSHAENEYLQAIVDWGVPGAIALAIALAWLIIVALRHRIDGPLAAGAIGGLVAVAAQSIVDFGVELPGLMIPVVALAATLSHGSIEEMSSRGVRDAIMGRLAMVAAIVIGPLLCLPAWGATIADDHDELSGQDPPDLADAQAAMRRHPLDYYAPARASAALFTTGAPRAMEYLNRALELHPTHPGLHRLAGKVLAATSHPAQAKLEYQAAMRYTIDPTKLVGDILSAFPKTDDALGAIWLDFPKSDRLTRALLQWNRADVALAYLTTLVREHRAIDTDTIDLFWRTAAATGDLADAEVGARLRRTLAPSLQSSLYLAQVLNARGKPGDAEQVLDDGANLHGSPEDVITASVLRCDVQIAQQEWTAADDCLRRTMALPQLPIAVLSAIHSRLATVADGLGDKYRAGMERALSQRKQ